MPETQTSWSQRRRARRVTQHNADTAIALCTRALQAGDLARASRAAVLAQRLLRLDAEYAEQQKKRAVRAAIEQRRAEQAVEEARKAIATLAPFAHHEAAAPMDW